MKEYTVITINPGSSSTKMGLVKGDKVIFDRTIVYQAIAGNIHSRCRAV